MAKAKTVAAGAEEIEAVLEQGADKVRETFEKAGKGLEKFASFQKESMEAWMESAGLAGKGAEKIKAELTAYVKSSTEGFAEVSKAIMSAKSVQTAMELQSSYAKSAFETYVAEMKKVAELISGTTKAAMEPIQARTKLFMEMVQTKAA